MTIIYYLGRRLDKIIKVKLHIFEGDNNYFDLSFGDILLLADIVSLVESPFRDLRLDRSA